MKKLFAILFILATMSGFSQNVGIGTATPDASAQLDVLSTSRGLLIPRMSAAQRGGISNPATGLLIYQTDIIAGFYYNSGLPAAPVWQLLSSASTAWNLAGNNGISPTSFLGTIDNQPIRFKLNSTNAGLLHANGNSFFGYTSGQNNTSAYSNVAIGNAALFNNTVKTNLIAIGDSALFNNGLLAGASYEAVNNTAVGSKALYANAQGYDNTAVGFQTLSENTFGSFNSALGSLALNKNTQGFHNTAIGAGSLKKNTTGGGNTALGSNTLIENLSGNNNIAIGYNTMISNTNGSYNTSLGSVVLHFNTTGSNNTALGFGALHENVSGYSNVAIGTDVLVNSLDRNNLVAVGDSALNKNGLGITISYQATDNTALGSKSLQNNTVGDANTATGKRALYANDIGYFNTATGYQALFSNTSGLSNTAIGYSALSSNTIGSNNTAIGQFANVLSNNLSNATAIGNGAIATASNQVMLGNTSVISVMAAGSFVIMSDGRFKRDIQENVPGLDFINALRPVTYHYDIKGLNAYLDVAEVKDRDNNIRQQTNDAINKKEKKLYTGFVAQEVETTAVKLGYEFSGLYKPQNEKDPYGISYADFVVPLVKAIQEQQVMIKKLQEEIEALKRK